MPENKIDKPLVSVIVPCYNCAQYLSEALESIYTQKYSNWECVIVDDGSSDESGKIANDYVRKDKRFKYIYRSNKGVSAARNVAIANSLGRYILPLDADDKISALYIDKAVAVLEKAPNIKVVYCKAELFGSAKGIWDLPPFSMSNILIENIIFSSALFRRNDFDKTNGYSEELIEGYEDWDFWLSFIKGPDNIFQIPEVHFYYRIRENSRNLTINEATHRKLRLQIFNRHRDLYDKYINLPDFIYDYCQLKNEFKAVVEAKNYLLNSNDYLVGNFIMRPYRFFKRIFK